jgi:hypothetical protein
MEDVAFAWTKAKHSRLQFRRQFQLQFPIRRIMKRGGPFEQWKLWKTKVFLKLVNARRFAEESKIGLLSWKFPPISAFAWKMREAKITALDINSKENLLIG